MELMHRNKPPPPSLPGLISHIQTVTEREKAVIARELHDELGGMLVAASMDVAWLEQHITAPGGDVRRHLRRLRDTLGGAVDIKRKIIEELRPTLLDNVGLFAALRWLIGNSCARASIPFDIQFPDKEPDFTPDASIALFRIAQEALAIIMESKWVRSVTLSLNGTTHVMTLSIAGIGPAPDPADLRVPRPTSSRPYGIGPRRSAAASPSHRRRESCACPRGFRARTVCPDTSIARRVPQRQRARP
jgi:two-component system sensor histidine kinase UhpB